MRGILEGMGLTFSHLFRPKVTRLYPYEKPKLPPRSRGLIQLLAQEGLHTEFNLKCESCLLCEKACPPRAITIEYEPMDAWKVRPWFKSYIREGAEKFTPRKLTAATGTSKAGYYSPRISEYAVEYYDKPVTPCVAIPVKHSLEPEVDSSYRVLRRRGEPDGRSLETYRRNNGYTALEKATREQTPGQVRQQVIEAKLRGRGGAGRWTGEKWRSVRGNADKQKYVIF